MINGKITRKVAETSQNPMKTTNGRENAVMIVLEEVTKGVHKKGDSKTHYEYKYFGWREPIDPKEVNRAQGFMAKWKNIAIPARDATTVDQAWEIHQKAGHNQKRQAALSKGRETRKSNAMKRKEEGQKLVQWRPS